jgi:uncharacterized BrkB/YihY/UPF0761 family membrane protein
MNYTPFKETAPLIRGAVRNWQNDRSPRMGAALAYYIALSLAPTVLILLAALKSVQSAGTSDLLPSGRMRTN